ncbi:hypothetical protein QNJ95_42730 [Bradyrhizobium elkanii]|uniref:hypothetical protein n=1 Tax=Bradyrhizobium TaxID=374 RepID=UPI00271213F2|nr:hypothetical protein [Bradyrhizobium elkanii]WLA39487.1 hypothetical protein QNJ95_42730 [Bradyrhizobium elkanii]
MANLAFIVEGQLEQRVVNKACPNHRVVLLGANGDSVAIATICDRIETHFRLFSNRHFPIVVIFDREKRKESCEEIEDATRKELERRSIDPKQFIFFISDRTFECMFLAHIGRDGTYHATGCPATPQVDGLDGVSELKARLDRRKIRYHKTTTGLELFGGVRPAILAAKSSSFKRFQSQILQYCRWAGLA